MKKIKELKVEELPPGRILGIESSCDETAAAVVENGRIVLSSLVASQVELHAQFGGVFPEVASRQHIRTIYTIISETLKRAHVDLSEIDGIAVTRKEVADALDIYYEMCGWDVATGKPTRAKLEQLGLGWMA